MRTTALVATLAALAVPAGALAAKPPHPATPAPKAATHHVPIVMYVIRGKVTAYTAPTADAAGSVSLTVTGANRHAKALKGLQTPLTFVLDAKTKIVLHRGAAVAVGDRAVVKLRGPKKLDTATLQAGPLRRLIDQGPPGATR
jgi:hypothetical protein